MRGEWSTVTVRCRFGGSTQIAPCAYPNGTDRFGDDTATVGALVVAVGGSPLGAAAEAAADG